MAACANWDEGHRAPGPVPQVSVAVLLCKGEKVLVCRRKGIYHNNQHALPGGLLEFVLSQIATNDISDTLPEGETLEECACREVEEETGMKIMNVKFGTVTNTILLLNLRPEHYVTIYMKAVPMDEEQEPETLEPDECDGFTWVDWPRVPQPIFKPLQELLNMNYDPFV